MRWKQVGHDSVIIYFGDEIGDESLQWSLAIAVALQQHPPAGLKDFVLGYVSVLLQFQPGAERPVEALISRLQQLTPKPLPVGPVKEVRVTYNGGDLGRVAEHAKLSTKDVVALHSAPTYRVHLIGFTPGFPFLAGLDPRLHTPRLPKPRLSVKAGSIGIGGAQTGIYSVDSPGGWNIIGHTPVRVYDPVATEPFLMKAGDRVRFIPVT